MNRLILIFGGLALALSACGAPLPPASSVTQEVPMILSVSSTAFGFGQSIPPKYSCIGREVSPPLAWSGAPSGTQSFALVVEDPDAPGGTWTHWVIFNIPAATHGLPEAVPPGAQLPDGTLQGRNSSGKPGYNGPCPPSGTHRYFFNLYALDAMLSLSGGASKDEFLSAAQGHILAQGQLVGTYSK